VWEIKTLFPEITGIYGRSRRDTGVKPVLSNVMIDDREAHYRR
jgi:hypothetical protein